MKDTTKFKKVSVPAPDKIDLSKPVKGTVVLTKTNSDIFGQGQSTVQGKGKATKGTKYNTSSSGVRQCQTDQDFGQISTLKENVEKKCVRKVRKEHLLKHR